MFVVGITKSGEESNLKAFARLVDAQAHFDAHFSRTFFGEKFKSVVIFEMPGEDDARAAVATVKSSRTACKVFFGNLG
jgi:hypothetical protein